jgi:lysine/ornithine N-monooxygenase
MIDTTDELERALVRDLEVLGDRFRDEQLAAELYRALTNTVWHKHGGPDGNLSLSPKRAQAIVNVLRQEHGEVAILLEPLGWSWREREPVR